MHFPVKADLVPLLKGIVAGLRPFAEAQDVTLTFYSQWEEFEAYYSPEIIIADLTQVLGRVIAFTPQSFAATVHMLPGRTPDEIAITISNSGASLYLMGEIYNGLYHEIEVDSVRKRSTRFSLYIPLDKDLEPGNSPMTASNYEHVSDFYAEVRKRLKSHFKNVSNLENAAGHRSKKEGIFLRKVNAIIYANLDQNDFSNERLARAMALSTTHLFRKIKNTTGLPPRKYIQFIRLQKAREMLEKEKLNVSEVAYEVGFVSPSHFTRAFQKQFGFMPSALKR